MNQSQPSIPNCAACWLRLGIIKNQPFDPTAKQRDLLQSAVETAPKMILALRQLGRPTTVSSITKIGSIKTPGRVLRPNGSRDADVAAAVAYGKRVKIYPLSQAASPPPTTIVDAINVVYDSTIPYDLRFFQSLDRFVQHEPWIDRDRVMIDMLKSIGIEKGKSFDPDQKTQAILTEAISEARAWLDNRYVSVFSTSFNEGKHWVLPALPGVHRRNDDRLFLFGFLIQSMVAASPTRWLISVPSISALANTT